MLYPLSYRRNTPASSGTLQSTANGEMGKPAAQPGLRVGLLHAGS
jgi:hypothetical protein